jgi:hypothetical protein
MMFVVFLSLLLTILSTLYCSILSALLYRCIRLNHTFFSLIAFCTFLFHHHISLASCLPPLVTLNSFESHFSNASGHLYLHAICILSFMLRTFLKNSLIERLCCLFFKFPPFVLDAWTRLLRWRRNQKQTSATTNLCWGTTHSPGITLQSMQTWLSSLLTRIKSMWLQF